MIYSTDLPVVFLKANYGAKHFAVTANIIAV
jgi:hypothetical protein